MDIPSSVVYVGKGVVSVALLDTNLALTTPFRPIGNVPGISIKHDIQKGEHRESMSGLNVKDAEWIKSINVSLTVEVDHFDKDAYVRYTAGTLTAKTSSTPVTGQTLEGGATLTVGDRFDLGAMKVTSVTITDSTASPKTLVADTNYHLDANTGVITLINITTGGAFTGPLKAAYTPGTYDQVKGMTTPTAYYALMFEGLNQVTNKYEKRIMRKVTLPPVSELSFISEDANKATIEGAVLKDGNGDYYTLNLVP